MALTYTFSRFFNEGDLVALRAEVERLTIDWNERSRHVPPDIARAGSARLGILRDIVDILGEVAV